MGYGEDEMSERFDEDELDFYDITKKGRKVMDEFFDTLKSGGVAGVLKEHKTLEEMVEDLQNKNAEQELEILARGVKIQEREDEIVRLNVRIKHMVDKLDKEHEEYVRDLVNKDAVIRAMAKSMVPVSSVGDCYYPKPWPEFGVGECHGVGNKCCEKCIIDHFAREQEAKDAVR